MRGVGFWFVRILEQKSRELEAANENLQDSTRSLAKTRAELRMKASDLEGALHARKRPFALDWVTLRTEFCTGTKCVFE